MKIKKINVSKDSDTTSSRVSSGHYSIANTTNASDSESTYAAVDLSEYAKLTDLKWKSGTIDSALLPNNNATLESHNENEIAIGNYNDSISGDSKYTLFTVGCGTSETGRTNALAVYSNNYVEAKKFSATTIGANTLVANTIRATDITSQNIHNTGTIKTKNLDVTGSAHFFELIIDKIKSAGGAAMFTPADGFEIESVSHLNTGHYRLAWRCQDGNGKQRDNMWKVGDQALCMSFNQAKVGTSHDVSNKYYWALVTAVSDNENPYIMSGQAYHWIDISDTDYDGTLNPEEGDAIVMCGYRGTDDADRQSAIYISAYESLDKGIEAPLFAQYRGINDFDLESHRKTYFDAQSAEFIGTFKVSSGEDIETYIKKYMDTAESHAPYIGDDGYWYIWNNETKQYDKTNTSAKGDSTQGKDAVFVRLKPLVETAVVSKDDVMKLQLTYNISQVSGDTSTNIQSDPNGYHLKFVTSQDPNGVSFGDYSRVCTYYNKEYITDFHTSDVQPQYVYVRLLNASGEIVEHRCIPVVLEAGAMLSVTDEINTRVQNHETSIGALSGSVLSNTNNISQLQQTATSLTTTVQSNKTNINLLNGTVSNNANNISQLQQTASSLTSSIKSVETQMGGDNILPNYATGDNWLNTDFSKPSDNEYQFGAIAISGNTVPFYTPPIDRTEYNYVLSWEMGATKSELGNGNIYASTDAYDSTKTAQDYIDGGNSRIIQQWDSTNLHYSADLNRYYFLFTVDGTYNTFFIQFDGSVYIINPMIEIGTTPHAFTLSIAKNQSLISQTANKIQLQVNETNLKIETGAITLNGNTTINGSLNLFDDNVGMLLHGKDTDVQIVPNTIPDYTTFKNQNTITQQYSNTNLQPTSTVIDSSDYPKYLKFEWSEIYQLGHIPNGTELSIESFSLVSYGFFHGIYTSDMTVYDSINDQHPRRYVNNPILYATLVDLDTGAYIYRVFKKIERNDKIDLMNYLTKREYSNLGLKLEFESTNNLYTDWCGGRGKRKHDITCNMESIYSFTAVLPKAKFGIIGSNGYGFNFGNRIVYSTDNSVHFRYGDVDFALSDVLINQNNRCNSRFFGEPDQPDKTGNKILIEFADDINADDINEIALLYYAIYNHTMTPYFYTEEELMEFLRNKGATEYKIKNDTYRHIVYPSSVDSIAIVSSSNVDAYFPKNAYQGQTIRFSLKVPHKYFYCYSGTAQNIARASWGWSDDSAKSLDTTDRKTIEFIYMGNTWYEMS